MSDLTTSNGFTGLPARAGEAADELDQRFHLAAVLRRQINKVFPGHWSFMLGEIALYSFVVLLLSGTYLALYFDPSMVEVTYEGPFVPLRGTAMSQAFASTMNLSFVVRGGLFIRQIHH
jgi:ubiquinol-cytochrome c reductase cytochrome b subunit